MVSRMLEINNLKIKQTFFVLIKNIIKIIFSDTLIVNCDLSC